MHLVLNTVDFLLVSVSHDLIVKTLQNMEDVIKPNKNKCIQKLDYEEDSGEIGGSGVHFPSTPVKYLVDLRSRTNSQRYSSIYEDRRPKIEDIERSDGMKSA